MQTEFAFTLPRGYVDAAGTCTARARCAWRRRATRSSRCATRRCARTRRTSPCCCWPARSPGSATLTEITPDLVEELYAADFDHLQRLYERINTDGEAVGAVTCPHCAQRVRGRPHGDRGRAPGGMTRPSPEELLAETARLAHHFHWPLDTILDLEHPDRRRFLREADAIAAGTPEHDDF